MNHPTYSERVETGILLTYNADTQTWSGKTATGGVAVFEYDGEAWIATSPDGHQGLYLYLVDAVAGVYTRGWRLIAATANAYAIKDVQNGVPGWTIRAREGDERLDFLPSSFLSPTVADLFTHRHIAVIDAGTSTGRVPVRLLPRL